MNIEKLIADKVKKDERVKKAQANYYANMRANNLLGISNAQGEINKLKEVIKQEVIKELNKTRASLKDIKDGLTEEEYKNILFYLASINYMVDWIDILSTNINSTISKVFIKGRIEMWDNLLKLGKEVKLQSNSLFKNAESLSLEIADNSDDVFEKVLLLLRGVVTTVDNKEISVGDNVTLGESKDVYKVIKIDRRRNNKFLVKKEGSIEIWTNEESINLLKDK